MFSLSGAFCMGLRRMTRRGLFCCPNAGRKDFMNAANPKNECLYRNLMIEFNEAESADYGDFMNKSVKYAYIIEHHKQAIFKISTGEKAGQWKTHYYADGVRKILVRKTEGELINFLYDHYMEGAGANKTFERVFQELMDYKRNTELCAEKTIEDYELFRKRFMMPLSDLKISSITEETLRDWIVGDVLSQRPYDYSFKRLLYYMKKVFWYAMKCHYIKADPSFSIDYKDYRKHCKHKTKAPEDTYFSAEEIEQIRSHMLTMTANPRALIALFNIETGMRADEPVAIHIDDIHKDYIEIHRQQIRHYNPQWFEDVDYTKDTSRKDGISRRFPLTPRIREILGMAGKLPGESVYLFHDKDGSMISKDSYEQFLRRQCQILGLKVTNNHAFRKALNNNVFIPLGFSSNERAALLGHTVRTNEQHYSLRRTDSIMKLGNALAEAQI